ncbi:MAG: hypothetical protein WCW63_02195 [Acholeplasmataceae bacterium]|jgi:hypothetical protein
MKELILHRRINRVGGLLFNIGITAASLLVIGLLSFVFIVGIWLLVVLLLILFIFITLFSALLNPEFMAIFDSIIEGPSNLVSFFASLFRQAAIPLCVVSCLFLISSIIFFFTTPHNSTKTAKIIISFIGIVVSVLFTILILVIKPA